MVKIQIKPFDRSLICLKQYTIGIIIDVTDELIQLFTEKAINDSKIKRLSLISDCIYNYF